MSSRKTVVNLQAEMKRNRSIADIMGLVRLDNRRASRNRVNKALRDKCQVYYSFE